MIEMEVTSTKDQIDLCHDWMRPWVNMTTEGLAHGGRCGPVTLPAPKYFVASRDLVLFDGR